jgi:hypothetical protein
LDPTSIRMTSCAGVLSASARQALMDEGFVVIPGPIRRDHLECVSEAYDIAVTSADAADVGIGRTTTRVHDFVNRDSAFDPMYVHPPVLEACEFIIKRPFRLSQMAARTLRAGSPAQDLHVDYAFDVAGWPMLGFIFMVDEFRPDNGATRFVPGSHRSSDLAGVVDLRADHEGQILAYGPAGSMIVYNGSVWPHGELLRPPATLDPGSVYPTRRQVWDRLALQNAP